MRIVDATAPVIAVSGLVVETRIAAGPGVRTVAAGANVPALELALERELERGARGVISFGIAGGLVDRLPRGTRLVARAVVTGAEGWACDAVWVRVLAERLPDALLVDLAGVDEPVVESFAKRALHRATGAAAVDTESHVAAAIAAAHRLPFAAFRVVADSVERSLPPAASVALAPDGRISSGAVLRSLVRAPAQIPALLRTGIDARIAIRALSRGRRLLGPGLGYPDLGELLVDVA